MAIPLPSEFVALVPAQADDVLANTNATGAELRRILLGDETWDSLIELYARLVENWYDEDGNIAGDLRNQLCEQTCVQDAQTPSTVPGTTTTTTSTSTAATSTTTTTSTSTAATTTTTTTPISLIRTFSSAYFGTEIRWSGLAAGTYKILYHSGYYEIQPTVGDIVYGTIHSVTDGTNPLGGLLVATSTLAQSEGLDYNSRAIPRTVSAGGSIAIEIGYSSIGGAATNRNLTYQLVKIS